MSDNTVSVRSGGKSLRGWTSVSIKSAITQAARTFSVGITYTWPGGKDILDVVKLGDPCEVWIGDDPVLTGYIYSAPVEYDGESISVTLAGRSKTSDVVDCCPASAAIASSSGESAVPSWIDAGVAGPSGPVVAPSTPKAAQWKDQKIEQIVSDLCAPYGVEVVAETSTGSAVALHAVQPGETCFESINRLLEVSQLFATDDASGRLVLTKPAAGGRAEGGFENGVNILTAQASRDASDVFSDYVVEGQHAGSDLSFGESAAHIRAGATDAEVARHRLIAITQSGSVTPEICRQIAAFEQKRRRALLKSVTYTVVGWRDARGSLWRPNTLVHVKDNMLRLDEDLLIAEVTYSLDEGGMKTTLAVAPVDAFKAAPAVGEAAPEAAASWVSEVK